MNGHPLHISEDLENHEDLAKLEDRSHNATAKSDGDTGTGILASARSTKNRGLRKLTGRDAGLTMQEPSQIVTLALASLPVPEAQRIRGLRKLTGRDAGLTMPEPEPNPIVTLSLASLPVRSGFQPDGVALRPLKANGLEASGAPPKAAGYRRVAATNSTH